MAGTLPQTPTGAYTALRRCPFDRAQEERRIASQGGRESTEVKGT